MVILDGNSRSLKGNASSVLQYITNHMQYGISPLEKETFDRLNTPQEKKQRMKGWMTHKNKYIRLLLKEKIQLSYKKQDCQQEVEQKY